MAIYTSVVETGNGDIEISFSAESDEVALRHLSTSHANSLTKTTGLAQVKSLTRADEPDYELTGGVQL